MKVDEICMVDVSLGLVYSHLSSWSSIFILLKYRKKTHLHNSVERTVDTKDKRTGKKKRGKIQYKI